MKSYFLSKTPLLLSVLMSLAGMGWMAIGGNAVSISLFLLLFFYFLITVFIGRLLITLTKSSDHCVFSDLEALISGNIILGCLMSLLILLLHIPALIAFITLSVIILSFSFVFASRFKFQKDDNKSDLLRLSFIVILSIGMGTVLCKAVLVPYESNSDAIIFKPWVDFFIHATQILSIGTDDFSGGRFEAYGEPIKFYHYGSYALPALAYNTNTVAALPAVLSLWTPVGAVLMALSLYSLARYLWGNNIAVLVVVGVMLIPDASFQLFRHSYFGNDWLLQASPGCYWGLALAAISLKFLLQGMETNNRRLVIGALFLCLLMPLIRAQFAIVYTVFMAVVAILHMPGFSVSRRVQLLFGGTVVGSLGLYTISLVILNPTVIGPPGGPELFKYILSSHFEGHLQWMWPEAYSGTGGLLVNIPYLLMLCVFICGLFLPIYVIIIIYCYKKQHSLPINYIAIPLYFLIIYSLNAWFMPLNQMGNKFEMVHRPFVIVYLLVVSWSLGLLMEVLSQKVGKIRDSWTLIAVALSLIILVPFHMSREVQGANKPYSLDLYNVSLALKERCQRGDVFLDSALDGENFVVANSQCLSYLSRPIRRGVQLSPKRAQFYEQRQQSAQAIIASQDINVLKQITAKNKVRWVIASKGHELAWKDKLSPVYVSGEYALFDLSTIQL